MAIAYDGRFQVFHALFGEGTACEDLQQKKCVKVKFREFADMIEVNASELIRTGLGETVLRRVKND